MFARRLTSLALGTVCALFAAHVHAQAAPIGGLFAPAAPGAGREPEVAEIAALLEQLTRHADARDARTALARARDALVRAREAVRAKDQPRATLAKQSAWASLGLASRRIALAAAKRAQIVAELRARRAEAACRTAEQRLAMARQADAHARTP
ncbi:MAG TPA: hypothetical protein VK509_05735 [Polyangiales bacterium]|nr:hypothetical protein [Polyangiales bacterium]